MKLKQRKSIMVGHLENSEIELKHILLELNHGRVKHMRHFIDSYYCYANNSISKNGNAKWSKLLWNTKTSEKAKKIYVDFESKISLTTNSKDRNDLIKRRDKLVTRDHSIPLKVISKILLEEHLKKPLTLESLREVLDKQIFHTTITKDEDALLRINKLNDCMPASFYEDNHSLYGKWYARYVETGIAINDVLL
ncbi:hypothetical protein [Acinetobacter towneri]|uniref:hypothetical protein n=1 Tax=Acinetobacter towneri TaxID=202956 RepID=UPI003A8B526D